MRTKIYTILFFTFLFSTLVIAQENNKKQNVDDSHHNKKEFGQAKIEAIAPNSPQVVGDKIKFKDGPTTLMEIKSGGSGGIIILNDISTIFYPYAHKLYSYNGYLFWGNDLISIGSETYSVGDYEQGGFVIEVTPDGKHGLVVALQNQGSTPWYGAKELFSNSANFTVTGQMYKDWRLPTLRELGIIKAKKNEINIMADLHGGSHLSSYYWSSYEDNNDKAYIRDFILADVIQKPKSNIQSIRAVRVF